MTTDETQTLIDPEEWILSQLEGDEIDTKACLESLNRLYAEEGESEKADSLAELLQETLAEKEKTGDAFQVLEFRAVKRKSERAFLASCEKQGLAILGNAPEQRAILKNAGFGEQVKPAESFRRLRLLLRLAPGVLCYDKTWGFGVVTNVNHFYEKVEIDFDNKKEHEMTFSYASQTLDLIDDQHILSVRYKDPEGLKRMVTENPAEVTRMAIRSYGPMSVPILIEKLVPDIVPEPSWKRFWEAARKALKKDPLILMPAKRSEPIHILAREKAYDDEWFTRLSAERNMDALLKQIQEYIDERESEERSEAQTAVLVDRLAFVMKGAGTRQVGLLAKAVMTAETLGLDREALGVEQCRKEFLVPETFNRILEELSAGQMKIFLAFLLEGDRDLTLDLWLKELTRLDTTALTEIIELLAANGRSEACAEVIRDQVRRQAIDVDLLAWIWRNPDKIEAWDLGAVTGLADLTLRALENDHAGTRLRVQNQLRERFKQSDWIQQVLGQMGPKQRQGFFGRLKDSTAWPDMDHRSVLGHIIKVFPELEVLMGRSDTEAPEKKGLGPMTSERSYLERQAQLEKIIKVDIPQNSKEIGVARSYGDLRENFEYHAAKEMQTILMRRQAELEKMLSEVKPTGFEDLPAEVVGMGTGVVLRHEDGREETFYILGVWDRDEELGIISSDTRLAGILAGCREGDEVQIPSGHDELDTCSIVKVTPLPDRIRDWAAGPSQEAS